MIKFYQIPNCTTCRKAAKFLQENSVSFEPIDLKELAPNIRELDTIVKNTGVNVDDLFNKLGAKFKELDLKDKLSDLTYDEKLELLQSDGMLIKRPLAVKDNKITLGFKEEEYRSTWL